MYHPAGRRTGCYSLSTSSSPALGPCALWVAERARHVRQQALAPVEQGELDALLARWAGMLESAGIRCDLI